MRCMAMENIVLDKSVAFATNAVKFCRKLQGEKKEYNITDQLIRCATSIGANLSEACYAQSPADFISKVKIAEKEANESAYWIKILHNIGYMPDKTYYKFYDETSQIKRLLSAIIVCKKKNLASA